MGVVDSVVDSVVDPMVQGVAVAVVVVVTGENAPKSIIVEKREGTKEEAEGRGVGRMGQEMAINNIRPIFGNTAVPGCWRYKS